ncbi:TIP41-like protein [Andrographis paniculata]|uniref:TIP41-like protein n=1 Tax=Andrographis paniculata TaxID=175694 RepID=UPI0021E9098E|nr:TIP41-like protein [Andrographis paniculata]
MEWVADERELKDAGAEALGGGRIGFRIRGWEIESRKGHILNSSSLRLWEEKLQTSHFPEMVFGESFLVLKHVNSGVKIHFNAFDALSGWKQDALPPVEVPAAAKWKFRCNPTDQVILDYDYTFTTPYCGSVDIEKSSEPGRGSPEESACDPQWEDCQEKIDLAALSSKEQILFYDEIILYEDELSDNGVSLLTVKVRVMPTGWFLLLRFWLRVDGVLMRLRDTRMHCTFKENSEPIILRECCWREVAFKTLGSKGYPTESAAYSDPGVISGRLPIIKHKTQKLITGKIL